MWKFKRKPSPEMEAIQMLNERMNEQNLLLGEQLGKLTRLQYKTSQDIQGKLGQFTERIEAVATWQEEYKVEQSNSMHSKTIINEMTSALIAWLDDMDLMLAKLQEGEQMAWRELVVHWSTQILDTLALADVRELHVLGTGFDPRWSESIGTMTRNTEDDEVPYQIVEVVKRGYLAGPGTLLRKAQVITLIEGK